jgi:RNA polymerase sigma-70 factor (ECF subfamily)
MNELQFGATLARAQNGEQDALSVIWRAHHPYLLRYLRTRHPVRDVEDVAGETWLRVSRSLRRFQGDEHDFKAWFFTIARAASADWHRSAARRPDMVFDGDMEPREPSRHGNPEREAIASFGTARAIALLGELPPEQSEAIALRVIAGLDTDRVAEIMNKRPGTVRVLQHRGLRRLAEMLAADESVQTDVTQ